MDILWLDGGWVRPKTTIDSAVDWQRSIPFNQDIDMRAIARMSRKHQPGLLVVDRTVSGEYENYVTPEQSIPPGYLPYPWESCMTLGDSWSYIPKEHFKTTNKVIHILTDVVSRNGNLLLNVAPGPDGDWHAEAYTRLQEIGAWLQVNGEAIYGTTGDSLALAQGNVVFTHKPGVAYAICRAGEEEKNIPGQLTLRHLPWQQIKGVTILGSTKKIKWTATGDQLLLELSEKLRQQLPCKEAWVFKISY
jgi:alpha-L-fucosidase